ncbi:hypothetical protein SAMN05421788_102161 [Filimonas lacunae]|uniref:N-acetyltransferase domain-containing protein n=1 Tax=Filimonas lacunae TaxID=477680 RepID=A0A173MII4_9BACT|nr:GNAT family N-acetyltransferase [Filimonas lacunae]BAV07218.1 hypothetical protein FLA_3241 [Filimonas lacunae]SIS93099.1 hypothetical protein SAMN05421788_102161 [Filimonas lacunae]
MNTEDPIIVRIATANDAPYAPEITAEMESSAIARGTGIAKRSPESIIQKMTEGKAVIALTSNHQWVGFAYIDVWSNGEFVSNSGLIVSPAFRGNGVARAIKTKIFRLSRKLYPHARIFSITTGLSVMKMNMRFGFEPVTFNEITTDPAFWQGCKSCVNYNTLTSKGFKNCLCTALLYTPAHIADTSQKPEISTNFTIHVKQLIL